MMLTPTCELPFIDEHRRTVAAPASATWDALGRTMADSTDRIPFVLARVWGLIPARAVGPRPLEAGSALPGFCVTEAAPGRRLILEGAHRFSSYRLDFLIVPAHDRSLLHARSYAVFPGPHGAIYRMLVIDSRAHVFAVRHLLTGIARNAERARQQHHVSRDRLAPASNAPEPRTQGQA